MFWEPRKVQQTTKPHEEVKPRQNRFQIVKLEERIAPGKGRHWYHPTPRFCKLYPQYC